MNDDQDTTQDDSTGAQALAEASPQEVDAHRGILSGVLEQLSSRGIDVASLAEKAGVSTDDVNALSHDDLAGLTGYLAQHHPQELAGVASQFPQAQGLLGSLLGGAGGGGGAFCAPAREFEPNPIAQERAAKRVSDAMGRGRRTCFKEPHMGWNEGRSKGQRVAFGSSSRLSCPRSKLKKQSGTVAAASSVRATSRGARIAARVARW